MASLLSRSNYTVGLPLQPAQKEVNQIMAHKGQGQGQDAFLKGNATQRKNASQMLKKQTGRGHRSGKNRR
ncbi:MAG: hypothetical protein RL094_610 [Candidatus Parcubacteria bacterium]|jgi:hypothetical protein